MPQIGSAIGDFQVADFGQVPNREAAGKTVMQRWYQLVTYATGDQNVRADRPLSRPERRVAAREGAGRAGVGAEPRGRRRRDAAQRRRNQGPVARPRDYAAALDRRDRLALIGLLFCHAPPRPSAGGHDGRPAPGARIGAGSARQAAGCALSRTAATRNSTSASVDRARVHRARFRLRAPEMTTEEFLQAAQRRAARASPSRLLGQFLGEADLVKFARHHPTPTDAERAFDAGRDFVRSTAPEETRAVA
jgi:hypothetical protein